MPNSFYENLDINPYVENGDNSSALLGEFGHQTDEDAHEEQNHGYMNDADRMALQTIAAEALGVDLTARYEDLSKIEDAAKGGLERGDRPRGVKQAE